MAEQDWSKVELTKDMADYLYAKYGNNWKESNEFSDKLLDDLYNYAILKGKYLSMVESSKATDKDYKKLLVTDEMLEYVFAKYANK
nr:peptidase C48, SUMO/sentrin/Ubl1 [Tanacetum cinerariifolium]